MKTFYLLPGDLPVGIVSLGALYGTPAAQSALVPEDVALGLKRHAYGDWGNLTDADWMENDRALECGSRLLSAYQDRNGTPFWVITEADRSVTTVLLPDDY